MPSFIFVEYSDKFFSLGVFLYFFSTKMENMTHKTEEMIFLEWLREVGISVGGNSVFFFFQVGIWEFLMEKLVSLIHYFALPVPLIGAFRFQRFIFFARHLLFSFFLCRNCERECLLRLWASCESIPMRFATENDLFWNFLFLQWTTHTLNRTQFLNRTELHRRCSSWEWRFLFLVI